MKYFELAKYKGKWAVYAKTSRTFHFIGRGKRFCENKVNELNNNSIPQSFPWSYTERKDG